MRAFQQHRGLHEHGTCDESTWLALVEASWRLGDRPLRLIAPNMRGDDVGALAVPARQARVRLRTRRRHLRPPHRSGAAGLPAQLRPRGRWHLRSRDGQGARRDQLANRVRTGRCNAPRDRTARQRRRLAARYAHRGRPVRRPVVAHTVGRAGAARRRREGDRRRRARPLVPSCRREPARGQRVHRVRGPRRTDGDHVLLLDRGLRVGGRPLAGMPARVAHRGDGRAPRPPGRRDAPAKCCARRA